MEEEKKCKVKFLIIFKLYIYTVNLDNINKQDTGYFCN